MYCDECNKFWEECNCLDEINKKEKTMDKGECWLCSEWEYMFSVNIKNKNETIGGVETIEKGMCNKLKAVREGHVESCEEFKRRKN